MRRKLLLLALVPVLTLGAVSILLGGFGQSAQADHVPGHPTIQTVARSEFIDEVSAQFWLRRIDTKPYIDIPVPNASEVVVLRIRFGPGDAIPWHTHPGPAIVAIMQGELTNTNASDCIPRLYAAGQAFLDPGAPHVHRVDNLGTEDVVVHVTFLGIPPGSAPTDLEPPGC